MHHCKASQSPGKSGSPGKMVQDGEKHGSFLGSQTPFQIPKRCFDGPRTDSEEMSLFAKDLVTSVHSWASFLGKITAL